MPPLFIAILSSSGHFFVLLLCSTRQLHCSCHFGHAVPLSLAMWHSSFYCSTNYWSIVLSNRVHVTFHLGFDPPSLSVIVSLATHLTLCHTDSFHVSSPCPHISPHVSLCHFSSISPYSLILYVNPTFLLSLALSCHCYPLAVVGIWRTISPLISSHCLLWVSVESPPLRTHTDPAPYSINLPTSAAGISIRIWVCLR